MEKNKPKETTSVKYVFGPVPSRRLGRSLGIDLVPPKTCTYDCIYCQLGRTTLQTLERKAYVPKGEVVKQLQETLPILSDPPDYITFSGSGEPTLHSEIGWVIQEAKKLTPIPIAVLTNGSLLHLETVREALLPADLIIPSLDASNPPLFKMIHRPHHSLRFGQILKGLREFREAYKGRIWLEIMLCGGINDDPKEIERIRERVEEIGPDKIQLNTVVRPPAENFAHPLSLEQMKRICGLFDGRAEILSRECPARASRIYGQIDQEVLALLKRRPCSLEDLTRAFGISEEEMGKYLQDLRVKGIVRFNIYNHTIFYRVVMD